MCVVCECVSSSVVRVVRCVVLFSHTCLCRLLRSAALSLLVFCYLRTIYSRTCCPGVRVAGRMLNG